MNEFGKYLRTFRNRCRDPENHGRRLSQERFGELIGRELGTRGFSGAAVSDWERGKSKIHADDRLVLISLLIVLRRQVGIRTVSDANELLEAGNYRALNTAERERIFPDTPELDSSSQQSDLQNTDHPSLGQTLFTANYDELWILLDKAREGPEPVWPRIFVALIRVFLDRWSALQTLKALLWFWVWLFAWGFVAPSLHWPFSSHDDATSAMSLYTGGALAIPALIGVLTDTKDNTFWQQHNLATAAVTRLYTYQGAYIGFHVGYFAAFIVGLLRYYLHLQSTALFDLTAILLPLVLGYMGARLVPNNLWQAYGRLNITDGKVFFFFIVFGPLWSFLFLEFYSYLLTPVLGAVIILVAITASVILMAGKYRRRGIALIPLYWWIIIFGLMIACQVAGFFIK